MNRPYTKVTWQGYLSMHTTTHSRPMSKLYEAINEENRQSVVRSMQASYPGNYTVIYRPNPDGTWSWQLVFDSPQDETLFRLKYT